MSDRAEKNRAYYLANKERIAKKQAEWRAANPEKWRAAANAAERAYYARKTGRSA